MLRHAVCVVGAGAFGVASAIELRRRGFVVTLVDGGPVPHPLAASTDISKFVRMDYGADDLFTELGRQALEGWDRLNLDLEEQLYHETGLLVMSSREMVEGSFEYDSFVRVSQTAPGVERVDAALIASRFPAWSDGFVDGYFNPRAGWAASGRTVARLLSVAVDAGVELRTGTRMARLIERGGRVTGVELEGWDRIFADDVVVAAGAWTPRLVPGLERVAWPTAHPIFHLRVDEARYSGSAFPCWTADISRTGWYGFPAQQDGVLKIANHGPGRRMLPDESREVSAEEVAHFREFAARSLTSLAGAEMIESRLCFYCDSWDGNFLIDRHPDLSGLVVVAGDSGHGFKFTPVIGSIVADVVDGRTNSFTSRFSWREPGALTSESARFLDGT